ncbi:MAG: hypothetical protein IJQ81_14050, partial [Oscillibacter sp.]|nr:hypothetical protein [Oscillibacter sp.]
EEGVQISIPGRFSFFGSPCSFHVITLYNHFLFGTRFGTIARPKECLHYNTNTFNRQEELQKNLPLLSKKEAKSENSTFIGKIRLIFAK